jgi:hypothetical protein
VGKEGGELHFCLYTAVYIYSKKNGVVYFLKSLIFYWWFCYISLCICFILFICGFEICCVCICFLY